MPDEYTIESSPFSHKEMKSKNPNDNQDRLKRMRLASSDATTRGRAFDGEPVSITNPMGQFKKLVSILSLV